LGRGTAGGDIARLLGLPESEKFAPLDPDQ
jgi:hypothetical protein